MRSMMTFAALLSLTFVASAFAQCCSDAAACPERQSLAWFAGAWTGEESWDKNPSMFPEGGTATSEYVFRPALGGAFVELEYSNEMTTGTFQGKAIFGWDATAKTYRMWWFNPTGEAWVSTGQWEGDRLSFEGTGTCGGVECRGRYVYEKLDENTFSFTMFTAATGADFAQAMTSTVTRVKDESSNAQGASLQDCCKERAKAIAAGTELPECCKKMAEAKAAGTELPACCQKDKE